METDIVFLPQPATGDESTVDQPMFVGGGVSRATVKARGKHEECVAFVELGVHGL